MAGVSKDANATAKHRANECNTGRWGPVCVSLGPAPLRSI